MARSNECPFGHVAAACVIVSGSRQCGQASTSEGVVSSVTMETLRVRIYDIRRNREERGPCQSTLGDVHEPDGPLHGVLDDLPGVADALELNQTVCVGERRGVRRSTPTDRSASRSEADGIERVREALRA